MQSAARGPVIKILKKYPKICFQFPAKVNPYLKNIYTTKLIPAERLFNLGENPMNRMTIPKCKSSDKWDSSVPSE